MSPLAFFTMIVAGQLLLALRATKLGTMRVLNAYVDLLRFHVEFDLGHVTFTPFLGPERMLVCC